MIHFTNPKGKQGKMKMSKVTKTARNGYKLAALLVVMGLCYGAYAAAMVLSGPESINVPSGTTVTLSDPITGTGPLVLTGGGTLALSNGENDFTGGIIVSNGVLRADAQGCFGENAISLEGTASIRQVQFNATKATFPNDITLKDKTSPDTCPTILATTSTTLTGNLTLDPNMPSVSAAYFYLKVGDASTDSGVTVTVDGQVRAAAGRFGYRGYGNLRLIGKVEAAYLYAGSTANMVGTLSLKSPENDIKYLGLYAADVSCLNTNVLRGCKFQFRYNIGWQANGHCFLRLNGYDQEFAYLNSEDNSLGPTEYACGIETGATGPLTTVTVNGRGLTSDVYAYAQIRVSGPVRFVVDSVMTSGLLHQGFKRRRFMSGDKIEVRNGRLRCLNGASFPNVTNVLVGTGSMIDCVGVTNVFENLKSMQVEGTGVVRCDNTCRTPFCNLIADVCMSADSRFYVGSGVTNIVDHMVVGGTELKSGFYTQQTLPQMAGSGNANYAGGTLEVRRHHRGLIIRFK